MSHYWQRANLSQRTDMCQIEFQATNSIETLAASRKKEAGRPWNKTSLEPSRGVTSRIWWSWNRRLKFRVPASPETGPPVPPLGRNLDWERGGSQAIVLDWGLNTISAIATVEIGVLAGC